MWKVRMTLAGLALLVVLAATIVAKAQVCPTGVCAAKCVGPNCLVSAAPTGGRPGTADICPNGGCASAAAL